MVVVLEAFLVLEYRKCRAAHASKFKSINRNCLGTVEQNFLYPCDHHSLGSKAFAMLRNILTPANSAKDTC